MNALADIVRKVSKLVWLQLIPSADHCQIVGFTPKRACWLCYSHNKLAISTSNSERYYCICSYFFLMHPQVYFSLNCVCNMSLSVGVSCGQLVNQSNGRVDTSAGTSFGDVARYSCDTGYTRIGPAERTCQADGLWSGSVPTCERELALCLQSTW